MQLLHTIAPGPDYQTARHRYALFLALTGMSRAGVGQAQLALSHDPASLIINTGLCVILYHKREHERAVAQFEASVAGGFGASTFADVPVLHPEVAPAEGTGLERVDFRLHTVVGKRFRHLTEILLKRHRPSKRVSHGSASRGTSPPSPSPFRAAPTGGGSSARPHNW